MPLPPNPRRRPAWLVVVFSLVLAGLRSTAWADDAERVWIEPASGHRVVQLSRDPGTTKFYFHQNAFTAQGDKMIVSTPTGIAVVNLSKLPATEIEPLLERGVSNVIVGRHSREVFYQRGGTVFATSLDTKKTREIAKLPPELRHFAGFAINADETLLAGSYVEPGAPEEPATTENGGRLTLEEAWAQHLPRRLFTLNIATGQTRTFHPSTEWLNHVQFSPTDPKLMMFCHEGPWQKVDRIWTIGADGSNPRLLHKRTMDMEIAGHEFFSADGRTVYFDLQTPRGKQFWLGACDLATGTETRYRVEREAWSVHYNVAPDGRHFAGDGGGPKSVAAPGNGQWIYLFTPTNGELAAEKLVDLSKHDYTLEPNVDFTPNGKWIVFQATMRDARQVYAVEVAKANATGGKPTIYLVGDSEMKDDGPDVKGWGEVFPQHFDAARATVENDALLGRSSRSFLREGLWDPVVKRLRPGDFVLIQFGHYDGGPINDAIARGTLPGNGNDTREVTVHETGAKEAVHSYGWYLRQYISSAKAKGATVIVCSPLPRDQWTDGKVARAAADYAQWAAAAAHDGGALFIDLNEIIADHYDAVGAAKVRSLFPVDYTHTNLTGAELNAECAAAALRDLPGDPFGALLRGAR